MTWLPFGVDADEHAVLVDGTPEWMLNSLREQFVAEFRRFIRSNRYPGRHGYYVGDPARWRRMELETRIGPYADVSDSEGMAEVFDIMTDEERLRVFDWVIRDNVAANESGNDELERILRDGGSRWKVGTRNGAPGLEERVPTGVQDAADAAMALPGDAGRLLSEAWHATYGVHPQPDLGYRKSIEAVEAIVLPTVMPNDATATRQGDRTDAKRWRLEAPLH